jgi:hypothetical protein
MNNKKEPNMSLRIADGSQNFIAPGKLRISSGKSRRVKGEFV